MSNSISEITVTTKSNFWNWLSEKIKPIKNKTDAKGTSSKLSSSYYNYVKSVSTDLIILLKVE